VISKLNPYCLWHSPTTNYAAAYPYRNRQDVIILLPLFEKIKERDWWREYSVHVFVWLRMLLRMFQSLGAWSGWLFLDKFDVTLMSVDDIVFPSDSIFLSQ
jgi:hypothetical protein